MLISKSPSYRRRVSASALVTITTPELPGRLCYIRSKVGGWSTAFSIILDVWSPFILPLFLDPPSHPNIGCANGLEGSISSSARRPNQT